MNCMYSHSTGVPTPTSPAFPPIHLFFTLLLSACLGACGFGDAGSSAAASARLKAQEAQQAQQLKANIESQLDEANRQAEARRKEAEAASR